MVFFANVKIWAFKQILEFWKNFMHHLSLTALQQWKMFLMRLEWLFLHMIFWYFILVCVDIWDNWITQETSILQVIVQNPAWVKTHSKCKTGQRILI